MNTYSTQMMIRTLIVDDEEIWHEVAKSYLSLNRDVKVLAQLTSSQDAARWLGENEVDMLLLDVQMPDISGISLVKSLKNAPHVVLMTSHPQFAVEGFDVEATDFLIKPFTFERLMQAVERVKKRMEIMNQIADKNNGDSFTAGDDFFFVRTQGSYVKVIFKDVLFIKAMENFVQIVTPSVKHTVLMPLSNVEGKLPPQFMRVHRSYIVNSDNVQSIDRDSINMGYDNEVPISEQNKEVLLQKLVEGRILRK